jgi:hypothetical protein
MVWHVNLFLGGGPRVDEPTDDELLQALDGLVRALQENNRRNSEVLERAQEIQRLRRDGQAWRRIGDEGPKPLIVELLSQNMNALSQAGSRLRRLEAQTLHDEGMTMEAIGQLFGVTRQRVSELLRHESRSSADQ